MKIKTWSRRKQKFRIGDIVVLQDGRKAKVIGFDGFGRPRIEVIEGEWKGYRTSLRVEDLAGNTVWDRMRIWFIENVLRRRVCKDCKEGVHKRCKNVKYVSRTINIDEYIVTVGQCCCGKIIYEDVRPWDGL
ncbi:hypothetical protein DRP04_15280 [Archaeoglobales archaeon]|nr:MAG: hypothetical protein DRP04_15280 [Archaeoglobales archaeon]